MTWFLSAGSRDPAPVQLFCLPYAGGGASAFRRWPAEFGPDVEVLPVQLPGRENRISEDPALQGRRRGRTPSPSGPTARTRSTATRWAAGSASRWSASCAAPGVRCRCGSTSAAPAPRTSARPASSTGCPRWTTTNCCAGSAAGGGLPAGLLDHPELVELLLPLLRADFGRVDDYRYGPEEPLPVPIVAFAGARRPGGQPGAERRPGGSTPPPDSPCTSWTAGTSSCTTRLPELAAVIRADLTAARTDAATRHQG